MWLEMKISSKVIYNVLHKNVGVHSPDSWAKNEHVLWNLKYRGGGGAALSFFLYCKCLILTTFYKLSLLEAMFETAC